MVHPTSICQIELHRAKNASHASKQFDNRQVHDINPGAPYWGNAHQGTLNHCPTAIWRWYIEAYPFLAITQEGLCIQTID